VSRINLENSTDVSGKRIATIFSVKEKQKVLDNDFSRLLFGLFLDPKVGGEIFL
jgi:hypothetical protein